MSDKATHSRTNSRNNWRKFAWVAVVLLVAGYIYGRPSLEKMLGVSLPKLDNGQTATTAESDSAPSIRQSDEPSFGDAASKPVVKNRKFELKSIGNNRFESPAGLVYTMGPRGEHRIDHVLRHGKDNPSRPVHSVFEGNRETILETVDEGYSLIKNKSGRVQSKRDGNRTEYTIDMQRKIGFEGGRKGKQRNYPPLRKLKLVLQSGNQVVTAYPYH